MKISIKEVKKFLEEYDKLNSIELSKDIILIDENDKEIKITDEMIKDWSFTRLPFTQFILYEFYK